MTIKRRYVDLPHGQLHFRELGSGPPLVLLHKTPSSSIQYARAMPLLAERFRTLALDTPGFGMSDAPACAAHDRRLRPDRRVSSSTHSSSRRSICSATTPAPRSRSKWRRPSPERVKRFALAGVLAFDDEAVRAEWRTYLDSHKFQLDTTGEFLETYPKPMLSRDQERSPEDPERYWLELVAYLAGGPAILVVVQRSRRAPSL